MVKAPGQLSVEGHGSSVERWQTGQREMARRSDSLSFEFPIDKIVNESAEKSLFRGVETNVVGVRDSRKKVDHEYIIP